MEGSPGIRYWPSLDGVRAVAVAAVIAFHLGYFPGGWVGVDLFFVLSGFLITSLLLDERARSGTVRLRAFWARRAKRLLPALVVVTLLLTLYAWLGGAAVVPAQLRSPAIATLFYFANWQQIGAGNSYFAHFQAPNPLQHTWSLSIEEQYYILWPLVVLGLALVFRRRWRGVLPVVSGVLVAGSVLWMGWAAHHLGVNRAYLGTDSRAWELLLGGLGAMVVRHVVSRPETPRRAWSVGAAVAAVGAGVGIAAAGGPPAWIWSGGLFAIALCALVVIAACVVAPRGPVARALAFGPLRLVGLISYSLYLWHWPVIVLLTPATTGRTGAVLLSMRVGAMVAGASASYVLVERPLRRANWTLWWRRALVPVGVAGTVAVVAAATVSPVQASSARLSAISTVHAASDPPASALSIARPVTAAQPLRVWLFGDSVMADSAPGITAALQATGDVHVVANTAFGGWGLNRDRTFAADSAQIIEQSHPEVVIGTWSWDDQWAEADPAGYLSQLVASLGDVLSPGNGVDAVVLLQFPQLGPNPYVIDPAVQAAKWAEQNRSQIAWNDVARQAMQRFPGRALYLSTQQLFASGGRFFTWHRTPAGSWVRARKLDNTHLCPYGAAEFGALLLRELTPALHLAPPAAGWQLGSWVNSPNYNEPPGSCPDDHPPPGYAGVLLPGAPS